MAATYNNAEGARCSDDRVEISPNRHMSDIYRRSVGDLENDKYELARQIAQL